MKIQLMCVRVEMSKGDNGITKDGTVYRCTFGQIPDGIAPITVVMVSPPVPGKVYTLLLRGPFPESGQGNYVDDMLQFSCTEHLIASVPTPTTTKDARDY